MAMKKTAGAMEADIKPAERFMYIPPTSYAIYYAYKRPYQDQTSLKTPRKIWHLLSPYRLLRAPRTPINPTTIQNSPYGECECIGIVAICKATVVRCVASALLHFTFVRRGISREDLPFAHR